MWIRRDSDVAEPLCVRVETSPSHCVQAPDVRSLESEQAELSELAIEMGPVHADSIGQVGDTSADSEHVMQKIRLLELLTSLAKWQLAKCRDVNVR